MKQVLIVLFVMMVTGGCSVFKAANAPEPVAVERVQVGSSRSEVFSVYGVPTNSENNNGIRTDTFHFIDGYPKASKSRVILYIAGDIFTLGLAELVFWPLEMAVLEGDEGVAVVTYDVNKRVTSNHVTTKDGKPWHEAKAIQQTEGESEEF